MCSFSFFTSIFLCLYISSFADQYGVDRSLSYFYNPDCHIPECNSTKANETNLNLVHVVAEGLNDTVHYLWSTYKLPCIIIAKTSKEAKLNVNWTGLQKFEEGSISFNETPVLSIGLILNEILEFDDEDDEVNMGNNGYPLHLSDFVWEDINATLQGNEKLVTAFPKSSCNETVFSQNGSFKAQFSASGLPIASKGYPHLYFTSNSTQLKIILDNFFPDGKKFRFALELMAVSSFAHEDMWEKSIKTSIDDEYSPGVFKIIHLSPPCPTNKPECQSFFTWKPVAYVGEKPTVANSSDASMSDFIMAVTSIPNSIATAYFNDSNVSKIMWNMTFGTSGDGFYKKTKYTSWSLMMGIGHTLSEKMSTAAVIVISVGLGAPLIIMLGGATFLGYTRCRREDDDLLLSQDSMN